MNKPRIHLPFRLAWQSIKKNVLRSTLTVFGIMIGIAMVIIVLSAGRGVQSLILDEISSFGDDWINIEVKIPSTEHVSQENITGLGRGVTITTLTNDDAQAIARLDNIHNIYAGVTTQVVASYRQEKKRPTVFGVSASYNDIDKSEVAEGRFFTEEEDQAAAEVIVLGAEIKNVLFGNQDPIGSLIKVDGRAYRVIGIMEPLGSSGFFNWDELVYIPLRTTQRKIMGIDHVLFMIAQMKDTSKADATAEEIRWLMRQRHDITDPSKDDFAVTTIDEALQILDSVLFAMTILLIILSGVSLIVGGVGIMNVMYVSVAERTFEIGLRKSVGAKNSNILWQFLIEAMVITVLGGIAGIIVGACISYIIAIVAQSFGLAWQFSISLFSIILGVGFSMAVGILFGLYPARQAARLDPIDAIRKE